MLQFKNEVAETIKFFALKFICFTIWYFSSVSTFKCPHYNQTQVSLRGQTFTFWWSSQSCYYLYVKQISFIIGTF